MATKVYAVVTAECNHVPQVLIKSMWFDIEKAVNALMGDVESMKSDDPAEWYPDVYQFPYTKVEEVDKKLMHKAPMSPVYKIYDGYDEYYMWVRELTVN